MAKSDNRERMIERGVELFYENGYEPTGVQEITRTCGVPKGSFYYYFDSKEDFGLTVLDEYAEQARAQLTSQLVEGAGSPLTRLRHLLTEWTDALEVGGFERGCLAGNLCQEMAAKNPKFQRSLARWFGELQTYFAGCLREAQAAGELAEDEDPEALAEFVYNGWQGALLRMKASRERHPLDEFQRVLFDKVLRL